MDGAGERLREYVAITNVPLEQLHTAAKFGEDSDKLQAFPSKNKCWKSEMNVFSEKDYFFSVIFFSRT